MEEVNDYLLEIKDLSFEEHKEFLHCARVIYLNLERQAKHKKQLGAYIPTLLNVIDCHKLQSDKFHNR